MIDAGTHISTVGLCYNWVDGEESPWAYSGYASWIRIGHEILAHHPVSYSSRWAHQFCMKIFLDVNLCDTLENLMKIVSMYGKMGVDLLSLAPTNVCVDMIREVTGIELHVSPMCGFNGVYTLTNGDKFRLLSDKEIMDFHPKS